SVLQVKEDDVTPIILQDIIEAGDNRFALGLLDKQQQPVLHADVSFRLYQINGEAGFLKGDLKANYVGFDTNFVEQRPDGSRITHPGPEVGVYAAAFLFDTPGNWGAEIDLKAGGKQYKNLRVRFNVLDKSNIPAIGGQA